MSEDEDRDKKLPPVPVVGDPDTSEMPPLLELPDNPPDVSAYASMPTSTRTDSDDGAGGPIDLEELHVSWQKEIEREIEQIEQLVMNIDPDEMEELVQRMQGLSLRLEIPLESPSLSSPFKTAPPEVLAILDSEPMLRKFGRILLSRNPGSDKMVYRFLQDVYPFLCDQRSGLVSLEPKTKNDTMGAATAKTFSFPTRNLGSRPSSYNTEKDYIEYVSSATQTHKSAVGDVEASSETEFRHGKKLTLSKNRIRKARKYFRKIETRGAKKKARCWSEIVETERDEVMKATKGLCGDSDRDNTDREDESIKEDTKVSCFCSIWLSFSHTTRFLMSKASLAGSPQASKTR